MNRVRKHLEFEQGVLSYLDSGNGSETIVAFHGFGQSAEEFYFFIKPLTEKYRVLVFDHFFHGESTYQTDDCIELSEFQVLFETVLDTEKISRFHILAYSLGGRWAFTLYRSYYARINSMMLVAPDGHTTTFYYNFSSRTVVGKWLFKRTVKKPEMLYALIRFFLKMGIISKSLYRFVYYQMIVEAKRLQVFDTWTKYRKFKGLSSATIDLINTQKTPILLLLGEYDRVIKPKWFRAIDRKVDSLSLVQVKKGHRTILNEISVEALRFLVSSKNQFRFGA